MQFALPTSCAFPVGFSPGFDASHPAARGGGVKLSTVALGGNHVNLISAARGSIGNAPARAVIGSLGNATSFLNSLDALSFSGLPAVAETAFTFAAIVQFSGTAGSQSIVGSGYGSGGAGIRLNGSAFEVALWSVGGIPVSGAYSWQSNVPYFMAATAFYVGATLTIYAVVRRMDTGAIYTFGPIASAATMGASAGTGFVGGTPGTASRNCNGYVAATMYSNKACSLSDLRAWAEQPWAFWYPEAYRQPDFLKGGAVVIALALSAVCGTTTTTLKGVAKSLTASVATTAAITKSINVTLAATVATTALIAKTVSKSLAVTVSTIAASVATFVAGGGVISTIFTRLSGRSSGVSLQGRGDGATISGRSDDVSIDGRPLGD